MLLRFAFATLALLPLSDSARSAESSVPAFSTQALGAVQRPWVLQGLLGQPDKPVTDIRIERIDGKHVLALRTQSSYGAVTMSWPSGVATPSQLSWSWRLEEALAHSDLRTKAGDDAALKVCLLFDLPLAKLPWSERVKLQLVRARFNQPIPGATLCYVWDTHLPTGTVLANPYTTRLKYIVLDTGSASPTWRPHTVHLTADFLRAFGHESHSVPALMAIAVGADADNTQGRSVGFVSDLFALP